MKLLIVTQVVDTTDPALSFMTLWISEIASRFETVTVICLKKGEYSLPENVSVYSLGKEEGVTKLTYIYRFYRYVWRLRKKYDSVFVHMNQEYILLAGALWLVLRKPIYMWRNHYAGSWLTDVAASFCTKVFCTSKHSYTAKYRRTVLMPVGIDMERFEEGSGVREPHSILFLARLSPSKRPEMFIDALGEVLARGVSFTASLYGSPTSSDTLYGKSLATRAESLGLHDRLRFYPGIPNDATPEVYRSHDIFVNCSPSGMFDKTLFEAAACGCRVIAASDDFHDAAGDHAYAPTVSALTERLIEALREDEDMVERKRFSYIALARAESLATLADRLAIELSVSGITH